MQETPPSPHPHTMMTSDEVDWLVYSYLLESGYTHTSFSLLHESALAGPSTSSGQVNGRKQSPSTVFGTTVPPGHLVRILQKGLLYLEAEARYRGDPPEPAPRLVGYTIPNALPLPPLPKGGVNHASTTPPATSGVTASNETASNRAPTSKDKGKGKEVVNGKRKGSDREDAGEGKRARVASQGDKKKGKAAAAKSAAAATASNATANGFDDDAMSTEREPSSLPTGKRKSGGSSTRSASPAVPRSQSPNISRGAKTAAAAAAEGVSNSTSASSSSALASFKNSGAGRNNASSTSAPTSPTSVTVPLPSTDSGKNGERRSSLPEGMKKHQAELAKIKKEEAEALNSASGGGKRKRAGTDKEKRDGDGDVTMDPPPEVNMAGVLRLAAEDGQVIRLRGHTLPKVQPCAWNPKVPAMLATGGGDSTCRIWDCPKTWSKMKGDGQVVQDNVVCKHSSAQRRADVAAVAWDPSGSLLATGSEDGIARIWTPSGDLHLVLSMHQRTIFSLKWNAAGTMLLTGSLDATVCLWELNSGRVKQQWSTHSDSVLDVDWNDDQTFASASMDKSIHLFNVSRVTPVHRFKGHRDEVNVVKFSPCGTLLASCSDDHTVRIWSLANIPGFALGDRLTAADEKRKIDEEDEGGVLVLEGHNHDVHAVAWAPQRSGSPRLLASASFDSTARLWDVDEGVCLYTFARHSDFVYSISFSPGDGAYLATGSNDAKMNVWSVKDRKLLLEYDHPGPIYEIAWHPNGSQLAVCGRAEEVACVGFDPTASPVTAVSAEAPSVASAS